jgi:hypothetical protein
MRRPFKAASTAKCARSDLNGPTVDAELLEVLSTETRHAELTTCHPSPRSARRSPARMASLASGRRARRTARARGSSTDCSFHRASRYRCTCSLVHELAFAIVQSRVTCAELGPRTFLILLISSRRALLLLRRRALRSRRDRRGLLIFEARRIFRLGVGIVVSDASGDRRKAISLPVGHRAADLLRVRRIAGEGRGSRGIRRSSESAGSQGSARGLASRSSE